MTDGGRVPQPVVALTGASGFLGSHIAEILLGRGYRVRAALRTTSDAWRLDGLPVERLRVELEDPNGPEALLDGAAHLIHCAGVISSGTEAGYRRGNVETTRNLLAAARRTPDLESFVLISSLAASGPSGPGDPPTPRRETDPCRPITAYGRSKLDAEALLTPDLPFRTAILRPPPLYGPRDTAFLPLFKAAARRLSMQAGNIRALSLLDGRDCARAAVLLMADDPARGPYYVKDGQRHTYRDMRRALAAAYGHGVLQIPLPMPLLRAAARLVGRRTAARLPLLAADRLRDLAVSGWTSDDGRLRRDLGFGACRDLETGFRETLSDYRAKGWIRAKSG